MVADTRFREYKCAMRHLRARSISTLVITVLVLTVSVVSAVPAWLLYSVYARQQENALLAMRARGLEQLLLSLENAVWNLDEAQIDGVLDAAVRDPSVQSVRVDFSIPGLSPRWRSRPRGDGSKIPIEEPKLLLPPAQGDIRRAGEVLGHVSLVLNRRIVEANLKIARSGLIAGVISADVVLIVALYVLLRHLVLKPVQSLQAFASQAEVGKEIPERLARGRFFGELEQLRRAVLRMFETLRERYRALLASQQRIADMNAELERRVEERTAQLDLANRELQAFAYSVSHDLRAPLRGIDGWSLALLEDCGEQIDATGRSHLQRVRAEAQRMGLLIDDLLRLSRVSQAELHIDTIDLSSMVRDVMGELRREQACDRLRLVVEPGMQASADPALLRVLMVNLLGNALKFSSRRPDPVIEVGTERSGGGVVYYVRDNGAGFDMADAEKLFSAFRRLHRQSEFPGTGIGLATVQRIVHRHGGRIWAEAKPDAGATFRFTLGGGA